MGVLTLSEGRSFPLGARFDGAGVNFALFSEHASAVSLCLYDRHGLQEVRRLAMPKCTDAIWHGYLSGSLEELAQLSYGYRVDGPPGRASPSGTLGTDRGHRFDSAKLLIDPYSRAFVGEFSGIQVTANRMPTTADLRSRRRSSSMRHSIGVVIDRQLRRSRTRFCTKCMSRALPRSIRWSPIVTRYL